MNDNPEYLKQYVREHPNNKMAWYLLGRSYAAKGEEQKALYCYRKSAEVYSAFEQRESPAIREVISKHEEETERSSRSFGWRYAVIAVALLMIVLLPMQTDGVFNSQSNNDVGPEDEAGLTISPLDDEDLTSDDVEPTMDDAEKTVEELTPLTYNRIYYLLMDRDELESRDISIQALLFPQQNGVNETITLAQAISLLSIGEGSDHTWYDWTADPNYLLTVKHAPQSGTSNIEYFDEAWCQCEPLKPVQQINDFSTWQSWQETEWILQEAMKTFLKNTGYLPESIEQLTSDYPNNYISGYTDQMELQFQQLADKMSEEDNTLDRLASLIPPHSTTEPVLSGQLFPGKLSDSIEIIVDRANYRLAIVHGNVIIRNYEVGVGGERTPLGEFQVTEKVRNPNGRPDGEFGSRGMTLSDTLYAIHGTDDPDSIGKDESLGCIRMRKEDVEELFDMIPLGTKVTIAENILPDALIVPEKRVHLPVKNNETNDGKVYRWLN